MAERGGATTGKPVIEELNFRAESVHICLMVNRKHRSARVVDFLAGNFPQKQAAIQAIAVRQGIERVFTLVEKEETTGWSRIGYAREGNIPGYYKRSDAYLMGHLVHDPPLLTPEGQWVAPVLDPAVAEKALNTARKVQGVTASANTRTQSVSEPHFATLRAGLKGKRAGWFPEERLSRAGTRMFFTAVEPRSKGGAELLLSAEVQEFFGNAYLQLVTPPSTEPEARSLAGALVGIVEQLKSREIASLFTMTPVGDTLSNAALLAAGFRKTGLLAGHLRAGERRVDTLLWARKTANAPADADAA